MKTRTRLHLTVLLALTTVLLITGCELNNNAPTIKIVLQEDRPLTGSIQTFNAIVEDPDENAIVRVTWSVTGGELSSTTGEEVDWTAPLTLGEVVVTAIADDGISNGIDSTHRTLTVVNSAPEITTFEVVGFEGPDDDPYVLMGGTIQLNCEATEPDGETITYSFNTLSGAGEFQQTSPKANTAYWIAPPATELSYSRTYTLYVETFDSLGYSSSDTLEVLVYTEAGTIWVVDSRQAIVSKYTALGHYILTSPHPFKKPVAVAGDISRGYGCYVADYTAGEVIKLDPEGRKVDVFTSLPNVADLALHKATRTLWVLSEGISALVVYNTSSPVTPVKTVYGFKMPGAIIINQSNNSVWISDVVDNSVIQLNALDALQEALPDSVSDPGVTVFRNDFNFPSGLGTRRQSDATIYIADQNDDQIERLTYSSITETYSRNTPVSIDNPSQVVSNVKGEVWVLNSEGNIQYFLESNINIAPFPVLSYAFSNPNSMAVDEVTGEVWIGDSGNHQLVKVLSPDSLAVVISGVDFVADIVVNR